MRIYDVGPVTNQAVNYVIKDFAASHLVIAADANANTVAQLKATKVRVNLLTEPSVDVVDASLWDCLFLTDIFGGYPCNLDTGTPAVFRTVLPMPYDTSIAAMRIVIEGQAATLGGRIYLINNFDSPPPIILRTYETASPLTVKGARRIWVRDWGSATAIRVQNPEGENRDVPILLGRGIMALDTDHEQSLAIAAIHNSAVPVDITVTPPNTVTFVTLQ